MNTLKMIQEVKEKATRLALAALIAQHLYEQGFNISTIDAEGVRVFSSTRKLTAREVKVALTEEMRTQATVFEDWLRPEDTILVALYLP